jgi:CBS domain-containing protein
MDNTAVKSCMTKEVVTISPELELAHGTRILLEHKFGCLPVVERGALVGIVTEIDFLRAFLAVGTA